MVAFTESNCFVIAHMVAFIHPPLFLALNGKPLDMDLDRICKFFIAHHRAGTGEFTRAGLSDILRRNGKPSKVASAMSREFFKVYDTDREGFLTFDLSSVFCQPGGLFVNESPFSHRYSYKSV